MKNLFKNLMLVAVAAMAFTACSQDVNEVNKVERTVRYEFTANIADDTRSGFAEKEDGATAYKSEWHEGDEVKVFIDNYGTVTTGIDTEGNFALELTDAPEPFFMTVCAPADSWTGVYGWTVPTEQTPLANSVDPKAHILRSNEGILVTNGTPNQKIVMSHYASYGKMTVNGVEFKINKVEVSFNGGQVYTINATNVENNTFWFAISDNNLTVSEFTVTAYGDGESVVTKTVTIPENRELKFNWGRVSTFSVSGLKEPAVPEETYDYTSAYVSQTWKDTDRLITFATAEGEETLHVNFCDRSFDGNSIAVGNYSIGDGIYGYGIYLGDYFGQGECKSAYYGNLVVSVDDGCYVMVFTDLKDVYSNVLAERITFKGTIGGLEIPDPRTSLDVPTNVKATVSGKTITLTWNPVDNVDGYKVWMFSPDNEAITEIVEGTQYVFEAQKANTTYNFNVYSYASDENPTYKTSTNWAYVTATTEDTDPKMELTKEMISFTAEGGNDTTVVTLKNYTAEIVIASQFDDYGKWFEATLSGNTVTVVADANEVEAPRTGTITITAGDISKTVEVKMAAKKAEGAVNGDGSADNPYVFTTCTILGGPAMNLSGADDGASMHIELWGTDFGPYDGQTLSMGSGPFYTSGNKYTINGTSHSIDSSSACVCLITKISDYHIDLLFKVMVGGNETYYLCSYKN